MKHKFVHRIRVATGLTLLALAAACTDSGRDLTGLASGSPNGNPGNAAARTPAAMRVIGGDLQNAIAGTAVATSPSVLVTDASGAAVPGVSVLFAVTSGGGFVQRTAVVSNAQGIADPGAWTLGGQPGTNTLEATSGNLPPVHFTATGTLPPSSYNIVVRWLASATTRQQQAVANAVARWQSVITKDLTDIPVSAAANACFAGQPAINERVDDIIIYVEFVNIDGAGQTLGEAGPCFIRSDNMLPVIGHLKLDAADLALMERTGTLDDVVMHEMGHILGIGTLWQDKGVLVGAGGADPRFTGRSANAAYQALGGLDPSIAVENTGADGTRDGHWRESVFGNELMTGYISAGGNPMSTMTISSLADLGYGANPGAASSYTLTHTSGGVVLNLNGRETMKRPKWKVDRVGKKTPLPY